MNFKNERKLIFIKCVIKVKENQRNDSKATKDKLDWVISVVGSNAISIRFPIHLPLISIMDIKIKLT